MGAVLKRWIILLVVAASTIWGTNSALARRGKALETGYAKSLNAYKAALHSGQTRKEVEDYLRSHNIRFQATLTSQWSDRVEIGQQETPIWVWYCGLEYVDVALVFAPASDLKQRDTDILEKIEIVRVMDCL